MERQIGYFVSLQTHPSLSINLRRAAGISEVHPSLQEEASGQNVKQPTNAGLRIAGDQQQQHPFFLAFA